FTEGDLLDTDGLEISGFIPTDLEYYNETTLFCTGYFITNQFEGILKSTNGGENWEYVHQATSIEPELQLNDLHVASNGDIYAVGKLGKVLKSVDDGETWTAQFVDGAGDLFQVFALDANRVSVGGVGGLFTSSNGGLIWDQEVTSDPITGISYKNSNVIMACTADDEILFTTNGGLQWSTEAFDFVNLVDVTYYSGDTWFLGSSTEVYRSDDNGASWFIQPTQLSFVPLFQLKHRNGLLIGRRQNIVIFSSDPSDIPTDYLVLNEVEAPIGACGGVQSFNLIVDNLGSNEITDLLIELHIDGELESTFEWSGSLPSQSSDQSVDLEINTGISTGEQVYEFTIIEVNNEVNNYPIESSGETNYSSAGLEGTIQIGSNGDFEDLVAFHEAVGDVSLCGDLTILLENGTYDAAYFYIDALGHDLTIEALNSIDPNVTVIGGLGFTGDSSSESHLIFRNINTTSNGLFLDPLRLQGYELIEVFNLNSSTEIEGNGDALELAADSAYVSMSSFTGGTSGIRFTGGQGTSLNIQNSNFQDHINGVFISGENDRIEINQSTFDIGNQALKINEAEYVTFSNNQCRGSNSLASMVEADTNESEGIGPRIQYFNNVIEHHHPHMLVGRGSARVLNNVFIRVGTENSFGPPIIMQNQTQADIQIKNNIFL
ncbi:MAG: YCF48-related protein, partial [Flavobacteriales bacterium]